MRLCRARATWRYSRYIRSRSSTTVIFQSLASIVLLCYISCPFYFFVFSSIHNTVNKYGALRVLGAILTCSSVLRVHLTFPDRDLGRVRLYTTWLLDLAFEDLYASRVLWTCHLSRGVAFYRHLASHNDSSQLNTRTSRCARAPLFIATKQCIAGEFLNCALKLSEIKRWEKKAEKIFW